MEDKKTTHRPDLLATLVEVAHLYYEENLSQQEIADRLNVSRSLIALYLKKPENRVSFKLPFVILKTCSKISRFNCKNAITCAMPR